jgi:ribosomal protein L40E
MVNERVCFVCGGRNPNHKKECVRWIGMYSQMVM